MLEGTQKADFLEIGPGRHTLKGIYSVVEGQKLVILAGAEIVAGRDAAIYISGGSFTVEGTPENPVRFSGERSSPGSWTGLKFNKAVSVAISNAVVESADTGLSFEACAKAFLERVAVTRCMNGIAMKPDTKLHMEDCLVAHNRENGIRGHHSKAMLTRCTVSENFGSGFFSEGFGEAVFRDCVVSGNRGGGIEGMNAPEFLEARNCTFDDNNGFDASLRGTKDWDFKACWWGKSNTDRLAAGAGSANLKSILDQLDDPKVGRVRLDDFLEKPPEGIGSTLKKE